MSEIIIKQDTLTYFETDKELYVQQSAFDASPEVEKAWDIYALRKNGIAAEPSVKVKVFMGGFVDILIYEAVPAFMLNYIVEKHKNVSVFAKFEKTARKEETDNSKSGISLCFLCKIYSHIFSKSGCAVINAPSKAILFVYLSPSSIFSKIISKLQYLYGKFK